MLLLVLRAGRPGAEPAVVPSVGSLRVCFGPVDLVSHLLVLNGLFSETRGAGGTEKSRLTMSMGALGEEKIGEGKVHKGCQCGRRDVGCWYEVCVCRALRGVPSGCMDVWIVDVWMARGM